MPVHPRGSMSPPPSRTSYPPLRNIRIRVSRNTYEASCSQLSSFEVSGPPNEDPIPDRGFLDRDEAPYAPPPYSLIHLSRKILPTPMALAQCKKTLSFSASRGPVYPATARGGGGYFLPPSRLLRYLPKLRSNHRQILNTHQAINLTHTDRRKTR